MNYIDKLCSITAKTGVKKGRDFVDSYFEKLGSVHKKLKVIHVAGTNGKGSTSMMIANGLEKAGFKVGLFTSPHLLKLNERIRINNIEISDVGINLKTGIEKIREQIQNIE